MNKYHPVEAFAEHRDKPILLNTYPTMTKRTFVCSLESGLTSFWVSVMFRVTDTYVITVTFKCKFLHGNLAPYHIMLFYVPKTPPLIQYKRISRSVAKKIKK
jgi:hypothetical protein